MSTPAPTIDTEPQLPVSKLHPLAPIDSLNPEDAGFKPYFHQLNAVFSNPDLRNVALIGNLGSGKSSILRSYDRSRPEKQGDFLFISLIDFENKNPQAAEEAKPVQKDTSKEKKTADKNSSTKPRQAQRLEYSLLCQILARCTNQDLRGSSLSGIPEPPKTYDDVPNCLTFLFLTAFPLFFREPLGNMLRIMGIPDVGITVLHGLLLCVLGFSAALSLHWLAKLLLPRLQFQKLSLKGTHAQADLALESGKHCLDQFKFELIHILDQLSGKIGCTVVFEDLERLEPEVCAEIMTKLRELNTLVNTHRQTRNPALARKPIRFIYATSDKVFDSETRTKFFDYMIPVVPTLNATNAEAILNNLLLNDKTNTEHSMMANLLPIIAPHLSDYRTLYSVLNEFLLFQQIRSANNKYYIANSRENSMLLSLAVYKVLFPREYYMAFSATGYALLPIPSSRDHPQKLVDMANELFKQHYLNSETLRLVGYTEAQIQSQWRHILINGDSSSKMSLLQRFWDCEDFDSRAFKTVVRNCVLQDDILRREKNTYVGKYISGFYFEDPFQILELLCSKAPSNFTPEEFLNYLAGLDMFVDRSVVDAVMEIGLPTIRNAVLKLLTHLDLELPPDSAPNLLRSWSGVSNLRYLFDLLCVTRQHLPDELLWKKIGDQQIDDLYKEHLKRLCSPMTASEKQALMDLKGKGVQDLPVFLSENYLSRFDSACIQVLKMQNRPPSEESSETP